jgi:hypothetical protein
MGRISWHLDDILLANQFTWFWAQGLTMSTDLLQNQLMIIWGDILWR